MRKLHVLMAVCAVALLAAISPAGKEIPARDLC
jgi:hypothetical protein